MRSIGLISPTSPEASEPKTEVIAPPKTMFRRLPIDLLLDAREIEDILACPATLK